MKETYSRREVLGMGALAGAALLGTGVRALSGETKTEPAGKSAFPWEYKALDVKETQARAYANYFEGGCMFGVFEAVAAQVAEKLGKPYTDFPFELSTYGGGGVALWGTLCGTCNGAAMAMAMFHQGKLRSELISEIYTWYEGTALPLFNPGEPKKVKNDFEMKSTKRIPRCAIFPLRGGPMCPDFSRSVMSGWSAVRGWWRIWRERRRSC